MKVGHIDVDYLPPDTKAGDWCVEIDGKRPNVSITAANDLDGYYEWFEHRMVHCRAFFDDGSFGDVVQMDKLQYHTAVADLSIYYIGSDPRYIAFSKPTLQ